MKGMDMVNADLVQVPSQIALGELLPERVVLVFTFRMHYFKPKSAILSAKWGQLGKQILP